MPMHKANVAAIRVSAFDPKNACDTRRTVAFLAECSCGWHAHTRKSYMDARLDVGEHLRTER